MFCFAQAQQNRVEQWPASQIHRPCRLFGCRLQHLRVALFPRQLRKVFERHRHCHGRSNALHAASSDRWESCAQSFMSTHNLIETFLQRNSVEWTREAHGLRDVVERITRFKLIEEPEALLCKRQRQVTVSLDRHESRSFDSLSHSAGGFLVQPLQEKLSFRRRKLRYTFSNAIHSALPCPSFFVDRRSTPPHPLITGPTRLKAEPTFQYQPARAAALQSRRRGWPRSVFQTNDVTAARRQRRHALAR